MSKNKILVTGGAGFIGSHLVDHLLKNGYAVRVLDNLTKPTHDGIPAWLSKEAEFMLGDVSNPQDVKKALSGVSGVFHEAAAGGFSCEITQISKSNSYGTAVLLEEIGKRGSCVERIVVASSVAVYGEGSYLCDTHGLVHPPLRTQEALYEGRWDQVCPLCSCLLTHTPTSETKPVSPETIYAATKYDQERMVLSCGRDLKIHSVALRYFLTYGPRQSLLNPYTGICSIFSSQLANNTPPRIFEDGCQVRDFVYVEDVAKANLLVFNDPRANGKVFNVGTGQATSVAKIAQILGKLLAKEIPPRMEGEFRQGEVRHILADISQIQAIGFRPAISIEEGFKKYIDWVLTQGRVVDYFSGAYAALCEGRVICKARPTSVRR